MRVRFVWHEYDERKTQADEDLVTKSKGKKSACHALPYRLEPAKISKTPRPPIYWVLNYIV